jgi:hypothetical protein
MTKKQEECREDDSAAQEDFDLHRLIEQSETEKHGERQPDEVDQDQERRIREFHRPGEGELRGEASRPLDGKEQETEKAMACSKPADRGETPPAR